ncbi:MAG: acyl-protein synthetase [Candidatus Eisenbacteria bacterium]|uniref:Acyl-protein synthetase n=1 Tax=Eiseniibacteriota bacterium TaxID=2212470 RepID=A0A538U798_UNCEI|nr:MAG: acyl-protein synthetase [Candidatus Eisenbacteria bacterium]
MKSPARELLDLPPYGRTQVEKRADLTQRIEALTRFHYEACAPYRNVVDRVFGGLGRVDFRRIEDMPFLPVSLFKDLELKSVPDAEVIKVLTSSGTTGQQVSRIHVDAETAQVQSAVLIKVAQHFLGKERLPMVILDHAGVVKDRRSYSARGAGILGMAQFGYRPFYALRDDMSLDLAGLRDYLGTMKGRRILLFGFTGMVWQHFVQALEASSLRLDLSDSILIHSGGWKKLEALAVSQEDFRERLRAVAGIPRVVNFYGMVEQVGGVYFENELHFLQAPIYSEVIVRDPVTLAPRPDGQPGLVQVVSCLPTSYPGHSLLTEDLGVIHGADLPGTAMKGRSFEILGRVPKAELRGCSDTFQTRAA